MSLHLVTGGAGFIGSSLVRALLEEGEAVRVLDDFSTGRRENLAGLDVEVLEGSVADPHTVARALAGVSFVYHLAALPSVQRSVEDPLATDRANDLGTLQLLEGARRAGVERFIFSSSSSVYGETAALPKREGEEGLPRSPYAVSKRAGEYYCRLYWRLHGLPTVALRYFNVYGERQDPTSQYAAVIPRFITALLRGERPVIYGDGHQSRDFTYVADVVAANRLAAAAPRAAWGEAFNVACGTRTSLLELLALLAELTGCEAAPRYAPPRPGDIRHSQADITKAQELLRFSPRYDIRAGLARTVRWYQEKDKGEQSGRKAP